MKLEASTRRFRGELRRPASQDNFMRYDRDVYTRRPTNQQRGAFTRGWGRAQKGRKNRRVRYKPATLRRLTWCNLGYRFVMWMWRYAEKQDLGNPAKTFEVFKRVFETWEPPKRSSWRSWEVEPPGAHRLKYLVTTKGGARIATNAEAKLLRDYRSHLRRKRRKLKSRRWEGNLQCDGYEKKRNNLIEAKACCEREHIRMAVGELFDYAYLLKKEFGKEPNKAILLPHRPDPESVEWLPDLNIHVVWREEDVFVDDANRQFS